MAKRPLRAVPDPVEVVLAVSDSAEPMSVVDASSSGSRLDELVAIRAILARSIDSETTAPRDLAALTRRHMEVSKEIEGLKVQVRNEAEAAANHDASDAKWDPRAV